jgi:hypothetical protein
LRMSFTKLMGSEKQVAHEEAIHEQVQERNVRQD